MFESHSDVSNFIVAYGKIEKVPFNLIYPLAVFNNSYYPSCAPLNEVLVYFTDEPISLDYMVKKQGSLSETKAWFVLN